MRSANRPHIRGFRQSLIKLHLPRTHHLKKSIRIICALVRDPSQNSLRKTSKEV